MKGLISVIVPVHNAQDYLSDCLASLTRQTWQELEILVVDDGSKDESADICGSWMERDARIRLIRKENGGVSSARNRGLEEARGEYVAFVDADDWILPDMLRRQLVLLLREEGDMILSGYRTAGDRERESFRQACQKETEAGAEKMRQERAADPPSAKAEGKRQPSFSCRVMDVGGYVNDFLLQSVSRCWGILFRREAIGKTRFPEELSIGEDLLFMARLMPRMKRVLAEKEWGYCYFINEAGAMLAGFRPSYMDQITCWELAEKELSRFGEEAEKKVRACLFQAALLTAGKLAEACCPQTKEEEYLASCFRAAARAWKELGPEGRKRLPAGYRMKGMIFLHAPKGYLRLYRIWKGKKKTDGGAAGRFRRDRKDGGR